METSWLYYLAFVVVGFVAGFINTLAGGGSLLVLPLLISFGLPPSVANGTNRIAILLQNISGSIAFRKNKVISYKEEVKLIIPAIAGSVFGALIAVDINEQILQKVIGVVLVIMLIMIVFKPEKALKNKIAEQQTPYWVKMVVFFLIGVYGGFIQAGVGFFLIAALTFTCGYNLLKTNALKVLIVLFYTIIALLIFILNRQVDFVVGLILASGNVVGAWIGANVSVKRGSGFVRGVLIVALVVFSVKMLFF